MGFKTRVKVFLASSGFLIGALQLASPVATGLSVGQLSTIQVLSGLSSVACMVGFLVCIDIYRLNPADSHTLHTLYTQYLYVLTLRIKAPYLKWWINRKLLDPKKENEKTLLRILHRNQNSTYGKEYKFSEIKSREDFVRMHPVTIQDHFKPYVDRITKGEPNVLSPDKTVALISTSGTTGTSKVYSFTDYYLRACKIFIGDYATTTYRDMINLQRYAQFHIFSTLKYSVGSIPIGAGSQFIFNFPPHNLIPEPYYKLYAEESSYYAQAVFSLAEREFRFILGFSADLMYSYWKFITKHWDNLCDDINRGELGSHVTMPDEVRLQLSTYLKADPARAAELRAAMKLGIVGLAKRVWPSFEFITMGKGAGFKMSYETLIKNQLKGVKIIDFGHGATEGLTGLNLNGERGHIDDAFTLILFSECFIEFIPIKDVEKEQPKTAFVEELKVGEMYEMVLTNVSGLYRNRYGDIIKVVGFNKNTPKYEFVYKLGQRLNIAYERTPDKFLTQALRQQECFLPKNVHIVDFTTTESVVIEKMTGNMSKGYYVFFVEFNTDRPIDEKDLAEKIDKAIYEMYEQYKRFKDIDSIGELKLIQVQCGTFDGLKSYIWGDTPHGQFKMPRVLRREPALRYLMDKALQSPPE